MSPQRLPGESGSSKRELLRSLLAKKLAGTQSYPLSFAQERLWFLYQLVPEDTSYIIPAAFQVEGLINLATLRQAVHEITRRHQILRSTFIASRGRPRQVIMDRVSIPVPIVDLTSLSGTDRQNEHVRLATESRLRTFDLTQVPLLRIGVIRTGESEQKNQRSPVGAPLRSGLYFELAK